MPTDFHIYWFWDRDNTRVPYRDPIRYHPRLQNIQTARNTHRILSAFKQIEQAKQGRAPPKCSACQGIGHKRNSHTCPVKIRASMARDIKLLQEIELSQTSIMPTTPQPTKRV